MQANVGRETSPEQKLRASIEELGFQFEIEVRPEPDLRCKADLVFRQRKVCVFIDGCFWHLCPRHAALPRRNRDWWREKLASNVARDRRQTRVLRKRGWAVLRVWEHDCRHRLHVAIARIVRSLRSRG